MARGKSQCSVDRGLIVRNGVPVPRRLRKDGYLQLSYLGKETLYHRAVWHIHYGSWPSADLDHKDGDRLNNEVSNLREVSHSENMQNKVSAHKQSKTGVLGVRPYRDAFIASIKANKKTYYLGIFATLELAAEAYVKAKERLHIDTSKRQS